MRCAPLLIVCLGLIFGAGVGFADESTFQEITNVLQLRHLPELNTPVGYRVRLEGNILWANPPAGEFVLQDDSGAALLEMDLRGQTLRTGQRARVTGNGTVTQTGGRYRLGVNGLVVDNDGIHSMLEKFGSIYLPAGRHPFWLDWFNGRGELGLEVEYSGPNLVRQKIPDGALFRLAADGVIQTNGLNFECFAVEGEILSNVDPRRILKTGVATNFDASLRSREDQIGLKFTGFIEVPRDGLYTFYTRSDDGSRLFIDAAAFQLEVMSNATLPAPHPLALGQAVEELCEWAVVTGTVAFASEPVKQIELRSGTGRMRVEIADGAGLRLADLIGRRVRAVGVCLSAYTTDGQSIAGTLLADAKNIECLETNSPPGTNTLRVLATAAEVHLMKREESQRGYPVNVRGVVTCVLPDHAAFTFQDGTRGLYALDLTSNRSRLPEIGDFLEVKGTTGPGEFAPVVNATELIDLGAGHLPEPVRPTWDQLVNGSLDAQYVELQGIITAVNSNRVTLLMREGRINVELRVPGLASTGLTRFENALVRVRGCLFANWDYVTHEVKAGEVRVYGAFISVDQPAPDDLFATSAKMVGELLLFDPRAGMFQRVKVAGQILHARETEFFMTDGRNGLRFVANKPLELAAGDLVEVVGFPELSGVSPVLHETVARKTGSASLPAVRALSKDDLLRAEYDSAWVQVKGVLVGVRQTQAEQFLEIQNGVRSFVARLPDGHKLAESLPVGCQLELTGVYSAQGGNKALGQDISSFEILLNSPSDIKVLARPPWWNLERMLVIVGALACVLTITVLWITQLHRKVEARTAELEIQIKERQRVEQQRAMEQERARVAQDLHDELGSSLTEISMLGARARAATATDERRKDYLEQMSDKAREMVAALDEIVWAMNPRHDSLASLVSYFSLYADRFLGLANIAWRLEETSAPPDFAVDSRHRHQLFLAFKEALTNVVRHSGATEVKLRIGLEDGEVRLSIADNGRGMPDGIRTEEMDGVANMRARVEKLGGRFELTSEPGRGMTVRFHIPASKIL
jgi:signal transduction histidine kinase